MVESECEKQKKIMKAKILISIKITFPNYDMRV